MKKLRNIIIALLIFGLAILALTNGIMLYQARADIFKRSEIKDQSESFEAILILGCGIIDENTPSPMLADRLDAGILAYQAGLAPKIIMSGDHGQVEYDEVKVMKEYALAAGVPSSDIFLDHAGFSTYDSIYRAKHIFKLKSCLIVSQKYHLSRALYLARSFDLKAKALASEARTFGGQPKRDLREIIARTKDFAASIIKHLPRYLGESININGDGTSTH